MYQDYAQLCDLSLSHIPNNTVVEMKQARSWKFGVQNFTAPILPEILSMNMYKIIPQICCCVELMTLVYPMAVAMPTLPLVK